MVKQLVGSSGLVLDSQTRVAYYQEHEMMEPISSSLQLPLTDHSESLGFILSVRVKQQQKELLFLFFDHGKNATIAILDRPHGC